MPERINHREAFCFAEALRETMAPYCERIEVGGSIRRMTPGVKDIELVAIPKWEGEAAGLFAEEKPVNLLYRWATAPGLTVPVLERAPLKVQWIKTGVQEAVPWQIKEEGKYWRASLDDDHTRLDLFLCSPETWGVIFFIRTGSRDFVEAAMVQAKRRSTPISEGYVHNFGKPIPMAEERELFKFLGLRWVDPENRRTAQDLARAIDHGGRRRF